MKTISIGDLHGHDSWNTIKQENFDKIIFIGDYVDSFTMPSISIKKNLLDVIEFKNQFPDKVILLWGNHDIQYYFLGESMHLCTGYRPEVRHDLHQIFKTNKHLFQAVFQIDKYLWTHAGLHKGWWEYRFKKGSKYEGKITLEEQLNAAFEVHDNCLFDVGHRRGGYHDVGGIFWADKLDTYTNPLPGYHQIIGHTHVPGISHYDMPEENTSVTYIDCLEFTDIPEFYELTLE